jgi:hypothetical protein
MFAGSIPAPTTRTPRALAAYLPTARRLPIFFATFPQVTSASKMLDPPKRSVPAVPCSPP